MSEITTPFDSIRQEDEAGNEYWSARDLAKVLGYKTNFRNFQPVIDKARAAIVNSGQKPDDHIAHVRNMIATGKGAKRQVEDYRLSRYACYLIVQNSDPNKPIVALGQTYFAEQTRRQELADQWAALTDDQKRIALRGQMSAHNVKLFEAARQAGVLEPRDFAIFQDSGYMGLYAGEKAQDIHKRKGLTEKQDILDFMDSEELGANIFRATQADAKIRREQIKGKEAANQAHMEVGKKVRKAIKDIGGTMPEELPTPTKSIQELEKKEAKRLKRGPQTSMFDEE